MMLTSSSALRTAAIRCRASAMPRTTRPIRFKSATVVDPAEAAAATVTSSAANATSTTATNSVPVVQSLLAALVGITTVSATAFAVETATADSVPAFDASGNSDRYDQSSFSGRFCRMLLACDPRLLLYSQAQVRQCQDLLQRHASSPAAAAEQVSDRALWEAKRVVDAAVHPDTGDIVPRPFRMSGYVPYNGPTCVAMVASTSTLPLLFWSWVNQSQNAMVNYYNRNASSPMTNETLAKSYSAAVGSALIVAFGLATAIQKKYSPEQARQLMRYVAFPSAVVASSLNCFIVRSPEMDSGVPLTDANGHDVLPGTTSQVAAAKGVYATTASRALLQAPVFFLPPALLSVGPLQRYLASNPRMTVPVSTFLLLVSFGIGLPATVAVFPQRAEISAAQVEERFQHLQNPTTKTPYEVFYYNKGL